VVNYSRKPPPQRLLQSAQLIVTSWGTPDQSSKKGKVKIL
jgi:hypothetical protein